MAGYAESKLRLHDLVIEPALSPITDTSDGNVGELLAEKEVQMAAIMERYMQMWLERANHSLGFPLNSDFDYCNLGQLLQISMNNLGDPFIESNYGVHSRDFEVAVLNWFACLWEIGRTDYWGYITNGGTEGNLHGLLVGREVLPEGILYASKESHYSVFKAARMYRMDCIKIETLTTGEIDCSDLKVKLLHNKDKPAILNINIGTTLKGAVDDLVLVIQTLEECGFPPNKFYIHCDAALVGTMLPFMSQVPLLTFKKPIGSISVSGHKFLGCPMPCGVEIVRLEHINALSKDVEYIASRDATISGSRNGHTPIFLWYALNRKGYHGLQNDVNKCLDNALYLKNKLKEAGVSAMLNELSNTVVLERPRDEGFIKHWQLACQGNIAHVVVMPNVTKEMVNAFLDELVEKRSIWLKDGGDEVSCFALEIGKENCACSLHK